jgi:hypothetical protein
MSSPAAEFSMGPLPAARPRVVGRLLGIWPLLAVTAGMTTIAVCLLVPQVAQNRVVRAELLQLRAEHARIQAQVEANDALLKSLSTTADPTLTARLAQRQLRILPAGTEALDLQGVPEEHRSPFQLVRVPAAATAAGGAAGGGGAQVPIPEFLADERTRLYLLAGALMLVAAGLICDGRRKPLAAA